MNKTDFIEDVILHQKVCRLQDKIRHERGRRPNKRLLAVRYAVVLLHATRCKNCTNILHVVSSAIVAGLLLHMLEYLR